VCVCSRRGCGLHSRLLEVGARGGYSRDRAALVSNGDGAPREKKAVGMDVDVAGVVKLEYGDIVG
jgi:hypothetical protein